MRKLAYVLTVAALVACVPTMSGHEQKPAQAQKPDAKKVQELMRRKLENAQKLLEALTLNDLVKASQHADELLKIRKEATFKVYNTQQYEMWADEFRLSAEGVITAAKEKNLEAAKLNYLGMTLACFHCHTYVRDQKGASADADAGE